MAIPNLKVKDNRYLMRCELRSGSCSNTPLSTRNEYVGIRSTTDAVRQRRKPRRLLPTTLIYNEHDIDTTFYSCRNWPGSTSLRSGKSIYVFNSTRVVPTRFDSRGSSSGVENVAIGRLSTRLGQFGETIAELPKTQRMIAGRINDVASLASLLRKGDWRGMQKRFGVNPSSKVKRGPASRRMASGWLELEFGWKPILQDVYSIMETYNNRLHVGQSVGARAASNGSFKSELSTTQRILERGPTSTAKVYGTVVNPTLVTLNQMGLTNPALIAWQLVPYSFVVDWFVPITSILARLTHKSGLSDVVVCTTTENGRIMQQFPGSMTVNNFVDREVRRMVTRPSVIAPWTWNPRSLGNWHIATAIALLRQSVSPKR